MAKTKISEFSSTPANNTDIDSINIAEGCAPSNINDAIRELMAQLKDFQIGSQGDSFNGPIGTTTAAAGAFTTLSASSTVTLSGGTANGVTYLNGSKVLTSGSALTFDGTNLTAPRTQFTTSGSPPASGAGLEILGGTTPLLFAYNRSTSAYLALNHTASAFGWSLSGTDAMLLNSTGLGIGTSSPADKLQVLGTIRFGANATYYGTITHDAASTGANIYNHVDSGGHLFQVGGTTLLNLTAAGNLGLGVTPSAWGSGSTAFQLGNGGIWKSGSRSVDWIVNGYYNGTNYIYNQTAAATYYRQYDGQHLWFNAASGTAGNAISFTQALTLNTNGALVLQGGNTSASGVGITFPATQSASSNANTLDDYEEGTFTGTLSDGTNSVNLNSTCVYTKVGRVVTVAVFGYNQDFSTLSATAHLRIGGLPFTPATYMACPIVTHNTSTAGLIASINNGDSQAYVSVMNTTIDANAATRNNIVGGASTFSFRASFTYFAS